MLRAPTLFLLLPVMALAPAAAQSVLEMLEADERIETRLFEGELERYERTRVRERQALQELRESSDTLDRAIKRNTPRIDELERLEDEVTQARETAFGVSRELAKLRDQLYRRMAKLAELDLEIRRARGRRLVPPSQLDGFWNLEFEPSGEVGLLELRVEGTLITGTYRLSGPRTGSMRGTLADNKVNLERIDSVRGLDSTLEGRFNPATRQIKGRWTAADLTAGRQGGGTWKAHKLSPAEEENLQVEPQPQP